MALRINRAKFRNFCKFEDFEIEFYGGVTRVVGMNGAGKSSVGLRGLIAAVKGIAKTSGGVIGDRFRFIGNGGKSADLEYQFIDDTTGNKFSIINHITSSSNKIVFRNDDGGQIDDNWLKGFLNLSLMSVKHFCSLSGQDQAKALGIDTSSFDSELAGLKAERTGLNARFKAFGVIEEVEKIDYIDVSELSAERKKLQSELEKVYLANIEENERRRSNHLLLINAETASYNEWEEEQNKRAHAISECTEALHVLTDCGYLGAEVVDFIHSLPQPEQVQPKSTVPPIELISPELPDQSGLDKIDELIRSAYENNVKRHEYEMFVSKTAEKAVVSNLIDANDEEQDECISARTAYISGRQFGFKGLSTEEDGSLTLNGRPIKEEYFSTGELELIVAKLHSSVNPELKVRFIDDFERIDEVNQEKILSSLLEDGFQVITMEVGEKSEKDNVIVLRDCKIDNGEEVGEDLI